MKKNKGSKNFIFLFFRLFFWSYLNQNFLKKTTKARHAPLKLKHMGWEMAGKKMFEQMFQTLVFRTWFGDGWLCCFSHGNVRLSCKEFFETRV